MRSITALSFIINRVDILAEGSPIVVTILVYHVEVTNGRLRITTFQPAYIITLLISDVGTPSKEAFKHGNLLSSLDLVLELVLIAAEPSRNEFPLGQHFQEQVLICI